MGSKIAVMVMMLSLIPTTVGAIDCTLMLAGTDRMRCQRQNREMYSNRAAAYVLRPEIAAQSLLKAKYAPRPQRREAPRRRDRKPTDFRGTLAMVLSTL